MPLRVSAPPSVSRAKSASSAKRLPQLRAFLQEARWSTESDELLAALVIVKSHEWKMIASRMNSVFPLVRFSDRDCRDRWGSLRAKFKKSITGSHGVRLEFII